MAKLADSVWHVLCIQLQAVGETIYFDMAACPLPGTGTSADPICSIQAAIDAAVSGVDDVEVARHTLISA